MAILAYPQRCCCLLTRHSCCLNISNSQSCAAQVQTKVMNNYMGIGVDAKVSLEFDRLRTKFPQWFKSQMGEPLCQHRT